MFTQLVMLSTVILLVLAGVKFLQRSKKISYYPGRILAFGLFLAAIGILLYAIRDIFVQFEMYEIQRIFLQAGGLFHTLGTVLIFWFVCSQFGSKRLGKIFFSVGLFIIIIMIVGFQVVPIKSEIVSQAPFEPFPYRLVKNYPEFGGLNPFVTSLLLWEIIGPLLLISITLYNVLKLKGKEERKKGLLYGFGFLFIFFPMLICMVISPIYARWGYLLGAILLYQAFKMKV